MVKVVQLASCWQGLTVSSRNCKTWPVFSAGFFNTLLLLPRRDFETRVRGGRKALRWCCLCFTSGNRKWVFSLFGHPCNAVHFSDRLCEWRHWIKTTISCNSRLLFQYCVPCRMWSPKNKLHVCKFTFLGSMLNFFLPRKNRRFLATFLLRKQNSNFLFALTNKIQSKTERI